MAGIGHDIERHAAVADFLAHDVHGFLDGDGVDVAEERVDEVDVLDLQSRGLSHVAVDGFHGDIVGHFRGDIGEDGDDALRAESAERGDLVVVAAVEVEFIAAEVHGLGEGRDVAVGLFRGDHTGHLSEFRIGLRLDVDAGTGRNVVQNDRLGNAVVDISVVAHKASLRGLVVVRRDHQ